MSARIPAAVAAIVAAAAAAAPASAAEPVRVTSPAAEAALTSRDVTVRVRTDSRAPGLRVTMYGRGNRLRNVTARFRRTRPRLYVARLRAGRELWFGRNSIFAEVRSGHVAERHFLVARAAGRPMTVRRVERGRAKRLSLDVRAAGTRVRARLNGKNARESFKPAGRGRWTADLTVRHGLRFGRNRLVVTVFDARGRFQRERRTFFLGHGRPLADAGLDRLARAGDRVRLDGRATRAAPSARGLRLRWRVVRKPKGSRPHLQQASGKRPLLRTDVNGTYRVELRATHLRGRASAAQVAAAAVDTVDVSVQPATLPSGTPVQTLATQGGSVGISVGSSFYPMAAGAAVQLLELDRTTLDLVQSIGYAPGEEPALLTELNGLSSDSLVILTGSGGQAYSAPTAVQQAITGIGGKLDGGQAVGVLGELTGGHGGWSVIGIPGIPSGQAYQLIGLQQGPSAPVGSMRGSFQIDSSGTNYAFNWAPEYHPFDTQQSATPTENVMSVDGASYPSWNLPFPRRQGTVGFQLLWFDADTLTLRTTATFDADLDSSYDDSQSLSPGSEHGMWGLRNQLRQIDADPKPALLVLNTIGSVPTLFFQAKGNTSDGNDVRGDVAARVTSLLEEFGANRYAYMGLGRGGGPGTTGGYSLVGVTGLRYLKGPNAAAELSTRLNPGTTARLAGVLKRSRQGVLQAGASGSPAAGGDPTTMQPDIPRMLAEPDQPFPTWSQLSADQQQAQTDIAGKLAPPMAVDMTTTGIRANYWEAPGLDWGDLANQLRTMCTPTQTDPTPCSTAAATLAPQLATEFSDVGAVRGFLTGTDDGDLWGAFDDVFLSGAFDIDAVANQIRGAFNPPPASTSGPSALGILSGVLGISGAIGAFVPEGGEGIAAAADVAASVTDIVEASTSEDSGESVWDPYGYHSTLADLAGDLDSAFKETKNGLSHVADLIVSDSGRLTAAAGLAGKPTSAGGWDMGTDVQNQLEGRLLQTMRQFMWLTMMQPVQATYECAFEDQGGVTRHNPAAVLATNVNYPEWRPRGKGAWNLYPTWIILANRNHFGFPEPAGKAVTDVLFGTPDYDFANGASQDGAGFVREYLLNRAIAGGGEPVVDPDYDRNVFPVTQGLVHKNMGMGFDDEDQNGLSHRNDWSAYTPSCGHGVRLIYSDPDPRQPDSPYANP